MTTDDEPEDKQNETLVNSLLAKISLSRRSILPTGYVMSVCESCDVRDEIGNI